MSEDRDLGLDRKITRKDFLNTTLLGAGGALLVAQAPAWLRDALGARVVLAARQEPDDWTGYGGVGDYARSNGNPKSVVDAAHRLRDGVYATLPANTIDAGGHVTAARAG